MNLPTSLTLLRILIVPFFVVVLLAPPARWEQFRFFGPENPDGRELLGVAIFLAATLTDILDGYLARRNNQITALGTLLDPIADKLLTSAAFISLVELGLAPAWMVVIIIGREFVVSGIRSILAVRGFALEASVLGKLKTASQIIAILLLILTTTLDRWGKYGYLGKWALWLAMFLALVSMIHYTYKFLRLQPALAQAEQQASRRQ